MLVVPAPVPIPVPSGDIWWEGLAGSVLQTIVLMAGAIWAYFLYKKRREFKPHVRVGASARISRPYNQTARLFIRLHIVNESGAHLEANASIVLWSVTPINNGFPEFREVGRDFPLDYAYGVVQENGVMAGPDGAPVANYEMEPLECAETEVLFSPDPLPELMAVRASVENEEIVRNWPLFWEKKVRGIRRWESFAYVDPDVLTGSEYVALTSHEPSE